DSIPTNLISQPERAMQRMKRRGPALVAATAGVLLSASAAHATKTWTGDTSATNLWTDATNWAGGAAPVSGVDDLVFAGTNNVSTSNTFGSSSVFKGVTFDRTATS